MPHRAIRAELFERVHPLHAVQQLLAQRGRAFAVDGKSAKGKPTSAGIIFIPVMVACVLLFTRVTWKFALIFPWVLLAALFGFLDDRKPWGAMTKAMTDIVISLGSAVLAAMLFPRDIVILALDLEFTILIRCIGFCKIRFFAL